LIWLDSPLFMEGVEVLEDLCEESVSFRANEYIVLVVISNQSELLIIILTAKNRHYNPIIYLL